MPDSRSSGDLNSICKTSVRFDNDQAGLFVDR